MIFPFYESFHLKVLGPILNLKIIFTLALIWHLGVVVIIRILEDRRRGTSLERLLKMAEIELCNILKEKIDSLPEQYRKNSSLDKWRKKAKFQIEEAKNDG